MTYEVTKADGEKVKIKAESFHQDGSALRLYDADGRLVAAFTDGTYKSCEPVETK
jgi:hypothetical protein